MNISVCDCHCCCKHYFDAHLTLPLLLQMFEMDAYVGVDVLGLSFMKGDQVCACTVCMHCYMRSANAVKFTIFLHFRKHHIGTVLHQYVTITRTCVFSTLLLQDIMLVVA